MGTDGILTLIMGAGGALAAAIGVLFRTVMTMHKEHREMLKEHGDMKGKIGQLKGEREGIERLSADVLETIHSVLGKHNHERDEYVSNYKNDTSPDVIRRNLDL